MKISKRAKKRQNRIKKRKNSKNDAKLMLNIVKGEEYDPTFDSVNQCEMSKHNQVYNFDILKTRRLIINDNCNQSQHPTIAPCSYKHSVDNTKQNQAQSCIVQFSNPFTTHLSTSINSNKNRVSFNSLINKSQYFNNFSGGIPPANDIRFQNENEVVYLGDVDADNSITTVNSRESSIITINTSDDTSNSIITLDTPDISTDLSRFEIVVTNTDCRNELDQRHKVNQNDSVICIDSNNQMEWTNHNHENDVITVEDGDSDKNVSLPFRRLKLTMKSKQNLIRKKKLLRAKNKLTRHTEISAKTCVPMLNLDPRTFREAPTYAKHLVEVRKEVKTLVEQPKRVEISKSCSVIPSTTERILDNMASNIGNSESIPKNGLREVIVDGSNVALGHTNGTSYSIEGLQIVIDYFVKRGHKVRAFVPKFRLIPGRSTNPELLRRLVNDKHVILTPSRAVTGRRITPYDDRFIIQYATLCEGIIVSNDCYRDLINEKPEWKNTIENRLLMPTWIDNVLMFPEDPLGRFGPNLTDFLKFPTT